MANYSPNAHWRDSARQTRFFIVDARCAFPLILFLLHIRWWTLITAVTAMCFFGLLERYGFTVPVFLRWFRSTLAGPRKIAYPWWRR